jgi:hypothetical protein
MVIFYIFYIICHKHILRCFPHVVNLACKAVIGVLMNVKHMDETQDDYEEYNPDIVYHRDLIANFRSLATSVCSKLYSGFHIIDTALGSQ